MNQCRKDFLGWAKLAKEMDKRVLLNPVKSGAICWCSFGMGIGTELYGKGKGFTRPGLILAQLTNDLILVGPITSQIKTGSNYEPIMVSGRTEYLNLTQVRPVSILRIGDFIDEVSHQTLLELKKRYIRFLKYQLYRQPK